MPLTGLQQTVVQVLAGNRDSSSYLAGGAAQHLHPNTVRFSYDLDYFHDSIERVSSAFESDARSIAEANLDMTVEISQPGFVRAKVTGGGESTVVEWSHDTAWRFFPTVADPVAGFRLHDVDLAVNKVLALVGRNEPRDFVDILSGQDATVSLGALVWAAAGKDPGYTPLGLLDRLRRRRTPRPEELDRLNLARPADPVDLKERWLAALADAEAFVESRPADEIGCLYWDTKSGRVTSTNLDQPHVVPHHGQLYGVVPIVRQ